MCREVFNAISTGVPVEGMCLYPIANHPGWDDDRHCCNGMFDYADAAGVRAVYQPLADEMAKQYANLAALRSGRTTVIEMSDLDTTGLDWAAHVMQERTDESRTERRA